MGRRFRMITTFEGIETGDRRMIAVGALTTRALPLTLMGMLVNPEFGGHGLAVVAGRIDTLAREDASSWVDESNGQTWGAQAGGQVFAWVGEGEFSDDVDAQRVEQLVAERSLRGVSVDLAAVDSELEVLEEDEDGWPIDWLETVTAGEQAAATVCNVPAFRGCTIELVDEQAAEEVDAGGEPTDSEVDQIAASGTDSVAATQEPWLPAFRIITDAACEPCVTAAAAGLPADEALVAAGGPLHPPTTWFTDPTLDGPTPLTVTDDGRIFGHLATWGTCHTGVGNACVTPPRSATAYSYFRLGAVRTAEGDDVAVGHITLGTGHADLRAGLAAATEHYDHTGATVADVAAGEDAHGIWIAGALRPDVSDEQLRTLRSASLSGDWRRVGTALELVAALAVNVPGFPVPRAQARVASGAPEALVAAGASAQPTLHRATADDPSLSEEMRTLAAELRTERLELAAERHLRRIHGAR